MNRIIGFDLGTRSLGVAISDSLGIAAHGYANFRFNDKAYQTAIKYAIDIIKKENIKDVVIGLALNMNGSMSDSANSAIKFKEELLKNDPSLHIEMIDERMSTMQANRYLLEADISRAKRKKVIDMQSAVVILETYLMRIKNGYK